MVENNVKLWKLLVRAARREPIPRTPVWIMRQAGRYLPQYRALREKYDFITMYKTPELAAEVTLQPIAVLQVDAAILFSDILVIPEAMGMKLEFVEEKGPMLPFPIREEADVANLRPVEPQESLHFSLQALRLILQQLAAALSLIGFSGSPWTLAAYMVEGKGSQNFYHLKKMCLSCPALAHRLLEKITQAVTEYCRAQVEAGADVLQLFDTWAGIGDEALFQEFVLPYTRKVLANLHDLHVPIIYFPKGTGQWLELLAGFPTDVIGLDWTVSLGKARKILGDQVSLQGNLDPAVLYATPDVIRRKAREMLSDFGHGSGHIANLGHGILPDIPPEHARIFVETIKEESKQFHV